MSFEFNMDKIKELQVEKPTAPALVSKEDSDKFITLLAAKTKMDPVATFTGVCIICQKGGTSRKAQGTVYAVVNGIKMDLNLVRNVINELKIGFTLRQWARTYASEIYEVSQYFDIEGDLSKKIARNSPSVTAEERFWLSNFQMDNPNCPQNVRNMLMAHYKTLFPGKTVE